MYEKLQELPHVFHLEAPFKCHQLCDRILNLHQSRMADVSHFQISHLPQEGANPCCVTPFNHLLPLNQHLTQGHFCVQALTPPPTATFLTH